MRPLVQHLQRARSKAKKKLNYVEQTNSFCSASLNLPIKDARSHVCGQAQYGCYVYEFSENHVDPFKKKIE